MSDVPLNDFSYIYVPEITEETKKLIEKDTFKERWLSLAFLTAAQAYVAVTQESWTEQGLDQKEAECNATANFIQLTLERLLLGDEVYFGMDILIPEEGTQENGRTENN